MARILLIDDEEDLRSLLRRLLEQRNHVVHEAADGNKGLDQLRRGDFDLAITDLVMPEKQGLETICDIRAAHPGLSIIAISGRENIGIDHLALARKFGADHVLRKPFKAPELFGAVQRVLGS